MKTEDIVKAVPVALLSVLATLGYSVMRGYFSDITLLFATLCITLLFTIYIAFSTSSKYGANSEVLTKNLEELTAALRSLQSTVANSARFSWILSGEQLVLIERNKTANCKEVWIVTPDLSSDTGDSIWIPAIQENASQGIIYKYIAADNNGAHAAIRGLKTTFGPHQDKCFIALISVSDYERFPHRHIVVYDPNNAGNEMDCFAEIDAEQRDYWIHLAKDRRNEVIGRAIPIVTSTAKPLQNYVQ